MTALAPVISVKEHESKTETTSPGIAAGAAISTGAGAALDWAGRAVDLADSALSLPKLLTAPAKHIPGAGPVIATLGSVFSAVFQGYAHVMTFGVGRWLQTLRRFCAVRGAVSQVLEEDRDISSIPVNSLLASISDQNLKRDLGNYFKLTLKRQSLEQAANLSEEQRQSELKALDRALGKCEVGLARRAEFLELKSIAGLEEKEQARSKRDLERRAELAADFMINRVEKYYKDKTGILGSEVSGEWVTSGNPAARAALKEKIYQRLLTAYQANRESTEVKDSIKAIKADLDEAFLVKSTAYQALFISVFSALWFTNTLPAVMNELSRATGKVGSFISQYLIPTGVKETFAGIAAGIKGAAYVGAAWLGIKGVAAAKSLGHDLGFGRGHEGHTEPSRLSDHAAPNHPRAEIPKEAARDVLPPIKEHTDAIAKVTGEHPHTGEVRVEPHLPKVPHVEPRIPSHEHLAPHERIHIKPPHL